MCDSLAPAQQDQPTSGKCVHCDSTACNRTDLHCSSCIISPLCVVQVTAIGICGTLLLEHYLMPLKACGISAFVQGAVDIFGELVQARLVGDCIAMVGALGGVLSLVASKRMRSQMVLSVYTLIMTATTVPVFLACSFLLDSPSPELNTSPVDGVTRPV